MPRKTKISDFVQYEIQPKTPTTLEDFCAQTLESLNHTLVERGTSYGSFFTNSEIAVGIQELLQTTSRDHVNAIQDRAFESGSQPPLSLVYVLMNAMNMIAAKQSRLMATPTHTDTWLDIAGYAILAHAAIQLKAQK